MKTLKSAGPSVSATRTESNVSPRRRIVRSTYLGLLVFVLGLATGQADPESPMFAGSEVWINGSSYSWDSATEGGGSHTDYYSGSSGGLSISGPIEYNYALVAYVGGSGGIDGIWNGSVYMDRVQPSASGGDMNVGPFTYQWASGSTTYSIEWNDYEYTIRSSGVESYTGNSGWAQYSWLDNGDYGWDYSGVGNQSTPVTGMQTTTLFDTAYTFNECIVTSSGSFGYSAASVSLTEETTTAREDHFSHPDQGWVNYISTDYVSSYGYWTTTAMVGWSPYLGSYSVDESGNWTFEERTAPTFTAAQLWINDVLYNWSYGYIESTGVVHDLYEDGNGGYVYIDGNPHSFFASGQTVSVEVGSTFGTLSPAGEFAVAGYDIMTSAPTREQPLFSAPELWVNGSHFPFAGGFDDEQGAAKDVYVNPSGGVLSILGNSASPAAGTVKTQYNSQIYNGSFSAGHYDVAGLTIATEAPLELPAAFWCAGQFYSRVEFTNSYLAPGGSSMAFSAGEGTDIGVVMTRGQVAWEGTFTPANVGIFVLTQGTSIAPACAANANGTFLLAANSPPEGMPPAVSVNGAGTWKFIGVAAEEGEEGATAAYYSKACNAAAATKVLTIHVGETATTHVTDYANATVGAGVYHLDLHLFQASVGQTMPLPIYGVDPNNSDILWDLDVPSVESGLPQTFIVWGEAWRYAGLDAEGKARYIGYYVGQELKVSPPDTEGRLKMVLNDPVRGEADAQGFLSDIRGSARLRSGTMVYSGNFEGVRVNTVAPEAALYTITADLDVTGNVISFGSLSDDPATAGAALQFLDDGETATLASSLGRPAAQWWWYRAGADNTPAQPAMGLDASNRLKLQDPQEPAASGVVLDPAVDGVSRFQGAVTVDGVLILTTPAGGISMGEFE